MHRCIINLFVLVVMALVADCFHDEVKALNEEKFHSFPEVVKYLLDIHRKIKSSKCS